MSPDEVKTTYTTYTKEDYERSVLAKLLWKLEDSPLDVKLNNEFVYDFRVPYTMFKEMVNENGKYLLETIQVNKKTKLIPCLFFPSKHSIQ